MQLLATIRKTIARGWFYALFLLLCMLVAYGLQISQLGFYWDDWQVVFLSRLNSASAYWQYFLYDRPFSAWTYIVTVPILEMSPVAWQLFTILVRWLGILAFCWALQGVWPARAWLVRWVGLLLAVYSGFTQQTISVAYSQHFITFTLYTLSLGLMVWAMRQPRRFWIATPLALVASLVSLLTMEYFIGLEVLRPIFLWVILRQSDEKILSTSVRVLKFWAPYLVVTILFGYWRLAIYPGMILGADPNNTVFFSQLVKNPIGTLVHYLEIILQDFVQINLFAWANTILPESIDLQAMATLFSWALGAVIAFLAVFYITKGESAQEGQIGESAHFTRNFILTGVIAVLFGGLPVWLTDRQVIVGLWSDRFTLGPMAGAAILIVGMAEWLLVQKHRRSIFLGIILGLALAFQVRTVNKYRLNWDIQREYYWQLYWRAPALKTGTAILGPKMPFSFVGDYAVGYGLNSLYAARLDSTSVPYWFIDTSRYVGNEIFPAYKEDLPIKYQLRDVIFQGNTSNGLSVAYNPSQGCLRVLDAAYLEAPPISGENLKIIRLSNPQGVIDLTSAPVTPPVQIFGREPAHDWCYYFQKGDLARQQKDWELADSLIDQAYRKGLRPTNGVELLPFIEGEAKSGHLDTARKLTAQAAEITLKLEPFLCDSWKRIAKEMAGSVDLESTMSALNTEIGCGFAEGTGGP